MKDMEKEKTILLVEDDSTISEMYQKGFLHEHFNVLSAPDGEEGLKIALEKHPDLLLVDVAMPKMDGITMVNKLREDEWGKDAKVIMLTSYDSNNVVKDSLTSLSFKYFVKTDFTVKELVEKIKEEIAA